MIKEYRETYTLYFFAKLHDIWLIEKPRKEENILTKEDLQITYYYRKLKFNLKLKMELKKAYINEHY